GKLEIGEIGPTLADLLQDQNNPESLRAEALNALHRLADSRTKSSVQTALTDSSPLVRAQAQRVLAEADPPAALRELSRALEGGAVVEKQFAFETLASMKSVESRQLLNEWFN